MKKLLFSVAFLFFASATFSQSLKWLTTDGGVSGNPEFRDLATDSAGNIYAIGTFNASNINVNGNVIINRGGYDAFLVKYNPNGVFQWIKTISGSSTDVGLQVETDQQGKVYISIISTSNPLQAADSTLNLSMTVSGILRFDSSGRFEAVIKTGMQLYDMKIHKNSIYARSGANQLMRLELNGTQVWSKTISGITTPNVSLPGFWPETSLEITPHENLIFSQSCRGDSPYIFDGVSVSGAGTSSHKFLVASLADTNGVLLHNYAWGIGQGSTMGIRRAIVDSSHNVYLAANFPLSYVQPFGSSLLQHTLTGTSYHAILKYDSAAAPQWGFNVSCANSGAFFFDLALDNAENISMLGLYSTVNTLGHITFPPNASRINTFTATISPAGNLLTAKGFGSNTQSDRCGDMQLLSDGSFAFGGYTRNTVYPCVPAVNPGFMVLKYSYEPPPVPDVSFTYLREQRKVYFSSEVTNANTVTWQFGDGTSSTQRNPVHTYTTPGIFTVRLIAQNNCGADTAITQILYKGIQKVLPGKIANNQFQIVTAKGGFPFSSATMRLKRGTHIITADSTAVNDSGMIQGSFLLRNEPLGMYDVIINSGSFTDTLFSSLEMEPVRKDSLSIQISGPSRRLVNRFQAYQVTVTNPDNVNYFGVPVLIAINPENEIGRLSNKIISDSLSQVMRDSAFVHDFYMAHDSVTNDSMWLGLFIIPVVAAQSSETIEFYMRGTTLGDKLMMAALLRPWYDSSQLVQLGLMRANTSCDFLGDGLNCIFDILGQFPGASCVVNAFSFGCAIGNLARDAVGNRNREGDGKRYIADAFNAMADAASAIFCSTGGLLKAPPKLVAEDAILEVAGELLGMTASVLNGEVPNNPALKLGGLPVTLPGSCMAALLSPKKSIKGFFIKDVSSMDPNDKTGPVGMTPDNFIEKKNTMQYLIRFENISTATAPASEVKITDTLDNSFFDLSTLQFTGFGFADSTYQVLGGTESYVQEIDLRPAKNTIVRFTAKLDTASHSLSWLFESLDPLTRELVADPNDGFLDPNQQSPEGEGFVSFSIRPLANRPHLQQVMNTAKIVFDENAPIFTNVWKNTVDTEKPTSHVLPLPAVLNDTTFMLRWSGSDSHAGIFGYDIYAIINDTSTRLILRNTPTDSIRINGVYGDTYKFYSVATDRVGNVEAPPGTPDAIITLSPPLPLDLVSFTARKSGRDVHLKWVSENEVNTSRFEVEYRTPSTTFGKIGTVTALNAPGTNTYELAHPNTPAELLFYRLKQVDLDGKYKYSQTLRVDMRRKFGVELYPNPTGNNFNLRNISPRDLSGLAILSTDGRIIKRMPVRPDMKYDVSSLPAGVYGLKMSRTDGAEEVILFFRQ